MAGIYQLGKEMSSLSSMPLSTVTVMVSGLPGWDTSRMRNLKKLLKERRLTQIWLAKTLGVDDVSVSRWVIGQRYPDRRTLHRIASVLHCEIEEITGEIDILTSEERKVLGAFRRIPKIKRRAFWEVVNALKDPDASPPKPAPPSPPITNPAKKSS